MSTTIQDVYVVASVRTAIGTFGGSLKSKSPAELGALVTREAVNRAGIAPESVDANVVGHILRTEVRDAYMSRRVAIEGGLPVSVNSLTVNRLCGSGLEAIILATQQLQLGEINVAVAGGTESMSRSGHLVTTNRWGQPMGDCTMLDELTGGLSCPFDRVHMGMTAENLADKYNISREEQDAFALVSQQRAANAIEQGYFKEQIVPVEIKTRKGVTVFDTDEHVRGDSTMEGLARLRPAFKRDGGSVTAGNASGINDGAAMSVLMSGAQLQASGATPMAKVLGYGRAGVAPQVMGLGPVESGRRALAMAGLTIADLDVIESNEAFAAQALAVSKELGLPESANPNGGAIALGHPIGASGAILFTKALYELARIDGRYALVTLCIGGGQGVAVVIERV